MENTFNDQIEYSPKILSFDEFTKAISGGMSLPGMDQRSNITEPQMPDMSTEPNMGDELNMDDDITLLDTDSVDDLEDVSDVDINDDIEQADDEQIDAESQEEVPMVDAN